MIEFVNCRNLQLFAEEAALPESGVTEADAQPQSEAPVGDPEAFEKLIKGPYKQAYDARVKGILQQRLKSTKQTVEAFRALEPSLKLLGAHYGLEEGDYEGLTKAIGAQYQVDPAEIQAGAERLADQWTQEEQQIRDMYPAFDLRKELQDPQFAALLRSRVDMRTAYEIRHKDEIIPAAMQYAAETVERKLSESLRSGGGRPTENGVSSALAAVPGSRVAQMTSKEIKEACLRVQRGEKISFG